MKSVYFAMIPFLMWIFLSSFVSICSPWNPLYSLWFFYHKYFNFCAFLAYFRDFFYFSTSLYYSDATNFISLTYVVWWFPYFRWSFAKNHPHHLFHNFLICPSCFALPLSFSISVQFDAQNSIIPKIALL